MNHLNKLEIAQERFNEELEKLFFIREQYSDDYVRLSNQVLAVQQAANLVRYEQHQCKVFLGLTK